MRNAAVCPAIDAYRQAFVDDVRRRGRAHRRRPDRRPEQAAERMPEPTLRRASDPARTTSAPKAPLYAFGNTDIYGGTYTDPTP